jgi:hypothetical protein
VPALRRLLCDAANADEPRKILVCLEAQLLREDGVKASLTAKDDRTEVELISRVQEVAQSRTCREPLFPNGNLASRPR